MKLYFLDFFFFSFTVKCWQGEKSIPREAFLENVKGAFALMCTHHVHVDGEVVDAAGI